jgi:ribosomal-protein-alanine N-acetyltransferase
MNTTGSFFKLTPQNPSFHQVYLLDQAEFPKAWSLESWQGLNWEHHYLNGWKVAQELKGFALFSLVDGDDVAHLLKVCVASELRGAKNAEALFNFSLEELRARAAKSVYLEVEITNLAAIKFYQKLGFSSLRKIKGYYSDGGDALTMQLTI